MVLASHVQRFLARLLQWAHEQWPQALQQLYLDLQTLEYDQHIDRQAFLGYLGSFLSSSAFELKQLLQQYIFQLQFQQLGLTA